MISPDSIKHVEFLFSGATALALVGHAVNTFPTPQNVYGQWLLGIIKFAVGQRQSAMNAIRGNDTLVVPVAQGTGAGLGTTSQTERTNTSITPESITTETAKVVKTSVTVPNPDNTKAPQ